jgi:hypothetical protein
MNVLLKDFNFQIKQALFIFASCFGIFHPRNLSNPGLANHVKCSNSSETKNLKI